MSGHTLITSMMRKNSMRTGKLVGILALMCMLTLLAAAQEDKSKRPSPPGTAEVTLKGKKITIDYSRPYLKGRHVGQELAPWGKVWRTGANEATTLTTEANLNIGGTSVPAGTYTLYSLPSEGTWKLIINKQTGQWGTNYDEQQDLARIDMQKSRTEQPVEQFTISFKKKSDNAADLVMEWENIRLTVLVKLQ